MSKRVEFSGNDANGTFVISPFGYEILRVLSNPLFRIRANKNADSIAKKLENGFVDTPPEIVTKEIIRLELKKLISIAPAQTSGKSRHGVNNRKCYEITTKGEQALAARQSPETPSSEKPTVPKAKKTKTAPHSPLKPSNANALRL